MLARGAALKYQDLVAICDIGERTDRSRESVRLRVKGNRGPGNFLADAATGGSTA